MHPGKDHPAIPVFQVLNIFWFQPVVIIKPSDVCSLYCSYSVLASGSISLFSIPVPVWVLSLNYTIQFFKERISEGIYFYSYV